MFSGIKSLIVTLLAIMISSHSPSYASQKIQLGNFSISFTGGNFDTTKSKGNLTGVSLWSRQTKIGSASSLSIHHSFSEKSFSEKSIEGQLTLSFENLNLKFKDESAELNEFGINIAEAYIDATVDSKRLHVQNITLQGVKIGWLNKGFGALIERFAASDLVIGLGKSNPFTSDLVRYLGSDIGSSQLDNFKITMGKRLKPQVEIFSIENMTTRNCFGYSFLVGTVPDHRCSRSTSNVIIEHSAIEQILPELSQALSQNGMKFVKLNSFNETSYRNVTGGYDVKSSGTLKVDGFGSFETESSITMNKNLWTDLATVENELGTLESVIKSNDPKIQSLIQRALDKNFLHNFKFTIHDNGLLDIMHSFIKNKVPAFRQMNRYQLSAEANKIISKELQGQPSVADMVNPSINRFINGAGEISLTINPQGEMSIYERVKLISDFDDFIEMFNVRFVN